MTRTGLLLIALPVGLPRSQTMLPRQRSLSKRTEHAVRRDVQHQWRSHARRRVRIHQAVVATFHARMTLVARDQQDSMGIAASVHSITGDLALIVDVPHPQYVKTGIGEKKSIQVNHWAAILPQESKRLTEISGRADHLPR